jgi:hypothetical protein
MRRGKRLWWTAAALGSGIVPVCLTVLLVHLLSDNTGQGPELRQPVPTQAASVGAQQNDTVLMEPLLDERTLYEDCRSLRERMSQIEREWSQSASFGGDRWESTVSELHRQADDLHKRIDRSLP